MDTRRAENAVGAEGVWYHKINEAILLECRCDRDCFAKDTAVAYVRLFSPVDSTLFRVIRFSDQVIIVQRLPHLQCGVWSHDKEVFIILL